ncbi:MAG: mandelate racemase/muconate lactonizing enzyme family protein [Clostridiales bacterium]|jgi:L-alanine-DL-glutamate epimerase-like enolase superfamily enzyme|nr:mandelate racemase/muconate lactonizing enzyme family protein [Clostridiales bacterium]
MKIAKVETAWIAIPCDPPQGMSMGDIRESSDAVVRITTDDGIRGIGEARGAPLPEICKVIADEYAPLLMGEDPRATQFLWDKIRGCRLASMSPPNWAPMRPYQAAQAAVDLALWDIKARAAGQSVCELLGGAPRPLPAYLSKAFYVEGQSLEQMCAEAVEELGRDGYRHLKIRAGRYGKDDAIRRVDAVRRAVGPDMKIGVDFNQAFDCDTALATIKALEPYDLMWAEEPIPRLPKGADAAKGGYDWDERLGEIARQTSVPLSSGENHYTLSDCGSLISKGGIAYMQFDMTKNGGLTELLKVSAACQANGILMAPHHVPHFQIMPAAACPNAFIIECYDNKRQHPAWPYLFDGFPEVKGGFMECPAGPGWGMEINDAFLKKHGVPVKWDFAARRA